MSVGSIASPWETVANNKEGGDYEQPPTGTHPAVLVGLVDLGTHKETFNGEEKSSRKILLAWELTAEADSKGSNFVVGQEYTWSLGKKANLRAVLEGWRGKAFADQESIDLGMYLGKPCQITLKEEVSKKGSAFIKISAVSAPMRGLTVPPATREPYGYSLAMQGDDRKPEFPDWLPFVFGVAPLDKLVKCEEWGNLPPF